MKKLKAVGALYFLLLITTIFLVIQTRITLAQEKVSNKELKNPILNTQRKIKENEYKIEEALVILKNHYDTNYHFIHNDASINLPQEDFIVYRDFYDQFEKKSNFNINDIIKNGIDSQTFSNSIRNSIEFIPTSIFDTNLTSIYDKLRISNIKIPITITENGKIEIFSPMLKISKINPFEVDTKVAVAKVDISIVVPYQIESERRKVYFKEYKVNTNEIIADKLKYSYEILDYIANVIITKQKYMFNNSNNVNVLAPKGAAIRKDIDTNTVQIQIFGKDEKIGIVSSGLMYINIEDLEGYTGNNSGIGDFSEITNNLIIRGTSKTTTSPYYPNDKFELDIRDAISTSLEELNLIKGDGTIKKDAFFTNLNNDYLSDNDINKTDLDTSIMFCSLNSMCGMDLNYTAEEQILSINNITTGAALKKMFSIFNRDIKDDCVVNGNNRYLLVGKKNPFAIEINSTDCGTQVMDFLIDNSSALNFGQDMFNQENNLLIFTLGLKNDLINGCEKCSEFPFIYKKYFIFKN